MSQHGRRHRQRHGIILTRTTQRPVWALFPFTLYAIFRSKFSLSISGALNSAETENVFNSAEKCLYLKILSSVCKMAAVCLNTVLF